VARKPQNRADNKKTPFETMFFLLQISGEPLKMQPY